MKQLIPLLTGATVLILFIAAIHFFPMWVVGAVVTLAFLMMSCIIGFAIMDEVEKK